MILVGEEEKAEEEEEGIGGVRGAHRGSRCCCRYCRYRGFNDV